MLLTQQCLRRMQLTLSNVLTFYADDSNARVLG